MKRQGRKPIKKPNIKEFHRLYYTEDKTARELAKYYNVSESTIFRWAKEMNL